MQQKCILVVDDQAEVANVCRRALEKEGHQVLVACNSEEAMQHCRRDRPDLVIMDIVMPEMDGITALREIIREDPAAKVVMCSALGQETLIAEAIEAGASEFIVKPFHPGRVLKVAQSVLGLDDQFHPVGRSGSSGALR